MQAGEHVDRWQRIVARAWQDGDFKERLLAEPAAVLREHGMEVPPGVRLRMVEDSAEVLHLPLPVRVSEDQALDEAFTGSPWGQVVTRAWEDSAFKRRLLDEPAAVLKERGIEVPAGAQVRIIENTDEVAHVTLPARRTHGELSDEALEGVSGGLVVLAIIGVLAPLLLPAIHANPKNDT